MIPRDYITEWRAHAPWVQDIQVEQDLVISRALIELFSRKPIAEAHYHMGEAYLRKNFGAQAKIQSWKEQLKSPAGGAAADEGPAV